MKVEVSSTNVQFLRKKIQWQILIGRKSRYGTFENPSRGVEAIDLSLTTLSRNTRC